MIIEFFGFPGSGKTTVTNQLVKQWRKEGYKVERGTFDHLPFWNRVSRKLLYSFICLFINPSFYIGNISFFFNLKGIFKNSIPDFLNITYLYTRYYCYQTTNNIIVFDQGVIQAYLSIVTFEKNGTDYKYKPFLKITDIIVILDLDLEKSIQRLRARKDKSSRVQKNLGKLNYYYTRYLSTRDLITHKNSLNTLVINAENDVKGNVEILKKRLGI